MRPANFLAVDTEDSFISGRSIRVVYTKAARECLDADKAVYDPKKFGTQGREAVAELVRHRIRVCTSRG